MRAKTYEQARGLLLVAGIGIVALVAATMYLRDVDRVEIIATMMFAAILAGFLLFGLVGGVGLALAAAGVYVGLRLPAIDLVGLSPIAGTVISRVVGYLAFGSLGGWAVEQIRTSLDRFNLIDEHDEATGLGNARAVRNAIEREADRAERYGHPFSVVTASFDGLGTGRRAASTLRELGRKLAVSIRASDRAGHVGGPSGHRIFVVLPETGAGGAETVRANLETLVTTIVDRPVEVSSVTATGGELDSLASVRASLES